VKTGKANTGEYLMRSTYRRPRRCGDRCLCVCACVSGKDSETHWAV